MTAYTSSGSGNFGTAGTWGGAGTPSVNGDTFSIGAGHIITVDVDLSGLTTGLGASVNNGTLQFKRTAGTYILKMNGNLTGTGLIDKSDGAGGAYPAGCIGELRFNGNFSNSMSGLHNIICLEPVHRYVKLSQAESAGATTLHIDTDLTGEPNYWKSGDIIQICNINGAAQTEQRTLTGSPTSTTIAITSGLTNSKLQGAYIVLLTRNAKTTGAGTGTAYTGMATGSTIKEQITNMATGVNGGSSHVIGGAIQCATSSLNSGVKWTVDAMCIGGTAPLNINRNLTMTGGMIAGATSNAVATDVSSYFQNVLFVGNSGTTLLQCSSIRLASCTFDGNTQVINQCYAQMENCVFQNNAAAAGGPDDGTAFNCLFAGSEIGSFDSVEHGLESTFVSYDHNQVVGAFKSWTRGGLITSDTGTVYGTRPRSYKHALELSVAGGYSFRDQTVQLPPGGSINVVCYIQKDASMAFLPRVQIFDAKKMPLLDGSSIDASATMTNSTNTWELLTASLTNTTNAPKLYKVRVLAQNASGNVYEDTDIRISAMLLPIGMEGGLVA